MTKDESKLMKEIDKIYKYLNISQDNYYSNSFNDYSSKKFGFYDYSKKSFLDNKTSIKTRNSYYGNRINH